MDLQKGREAFENHLKKMGKTDNETFSKNEDDSYQMDIIHFGWKIWQAAIARMEVRINTLDEMLLNQGEALAQAKAQAVPEGFVLIKTSDRDQEMLELIDQRDHMEGQAEELKDKLQALYGVNFGEHSSCNFPFQNAIDYDDSDLVLVKKELPDQIAEKMAIDRIDKPRHENDPVWSEIAEQSYKDQVKSKKWEFWRDYKAMIEAQEPAND